MRFGRPFDGLAEFTDGGFPSVAGLEPKTAPSNPLANEYTSTRACSVLSHTDASARVNVSGARRPYSVSHSLKRTSAFLGSQSGSALRYSSFISRVRTIRSRGIVE